MRFTDEQIEWLESQPTPPKALKERPALFPDLQDVWEAFWTLHLSRPVAMDVMPIPFSEIVFYWRGFVGIAEPTELADRTSLISAMDVEWLSLHRARQQKD